MNMTERAFVIDQQLQRLLLLKDNQHTSSEIHTNENAARVSIQAIVNAIVLPHKAQSKLTLQRVNASNQYVKWYILILASYTNMQSPSQIAASSTIEDISLLKRQGRGFTVELTQQACVQAETHLIVNIDQATVEQLKDGLYLHCIWQQQLYVVQFGVPIKNRAQALINTQDKAFCAIANPESHLYLT